MRKEEIRSSIKELMMKELELEDEYKLEEIEDDFLVTYNINSIDALDLLLQIENKFEIEIPDESLNAQIFESIENVVTVVQELLKSNA